MTKKWKRMKFLSFIIYDFLKFKTLNLIKDTLNKNKFLIWSNIKTKVIDQLLKDEIKISKKITSLEINIIINNDEKSIILIRNLFNE